MNEREIFASVVAILTPFVKAPDALSSCSAETTILGDLKVNSARLVDVMLEMEERFGIQVSDDEVDGLRTVGDAVQLVMTKTSPSALA
ncbi:MAG: acyl carrier protein [Myxococcota bacterium]